MSLPFCALEPTLSSNNAGIRPTFRRGAGGDFIETVAPFKLLDLDWLDWGFFTTGFKWRTITFSTFHGIFLTLCLDCFSVTRPVRTRLDLATGRTISNVMLWSNPSQPNTKSPRYRQCSNLLSNSKNIKTPSTTLVNCKCKRKTVHQNHMFEAPAAARAT